MAPRPNLSPDPRNSSASDQDQLGFAAAGADRDRGLREIESDVADLAAKFAEHSGGSLAPEFAADLALDIVLNEIAEQACLATGASGAAIALRRGTEILCRASVGSSAPALGARMDPTSGLSGLCIQTGQVQRCDDVQLDARADIEASERLGVRSIMVLPLFSPTGLLMGIFEVLCTQPAAFNEQDERTLEALARRALRNIERVAEPSLLLSRKLAVQVDPVNVHSEESPALNSGIPVQTPVPSFATLATLPHRGIDLATWLLGLIVLGGVILLGTLTSRRLGWSPAKFMTHTASAAARTSTTAQKADSATRLAPDSGAHSDVQVSETRTAVNDVRTTGAIQAPAAHAPRLAEPPLGGLQVFENGREVFRLPASSPREPNPEDGTQRVVELSAKDADANVIYRVEPEYPEQARLQRIEGKVVLAVRIRPDGTVDEVELSSGQPALAQAAIDAVKQWRFRPQIGSGKLVEMRKQITLNFQLRH